MGEHGDTQFPVWSAASIAGIPFAALPELQDQKELDSMAEASKNKAYTIIKAKVGSCNVCTACKCVFINTDFPLLH